VNHYFDENYEDDQEVFDLVNTQDQHMGEDNDKYSQINFINNREDNLTESDHMNDYG
jgi:hypothetical protein